MEPEECILLILSGRLLEMYPDDPVEWREVDRVAPPAFCSSRDRRRAANSGISWLCAFVGAAPAFGLISASLPKLPNIFC